VKSNGFVDIRAFKICKEEVGVKYFGGSIGQFRHSDFLNLSNEIFELSKISIGISTLKRIWKENYTGTPNISTLDGLAIYLGHENWNSYRREIKTQAGDQPNHNIKLNFKKRKVIALLLIGFCFVAIVLMARFYLRKANYKKIEFSFTPEKDRTIPNTVVFHYNIHPVKFKKAVIQPLGYEGDEINISANDSICTYTYTWLDIFYPKLVLDNKVAKGLKLELKTNGWKVAVSKNMGKDFYIEYLDEKKMFINGEIAITDEMLNQHNFAKNDVENSYFCNFKDYNIDGDTFHFETRIRSFQVAKNLNSGIHKIALTFENGKLYIPLSEQELPPNAPLKIFEQDYLPKNTLLSFLHINSLDWNTFGITCANKKIKIDINQKNVFSKLYSTKPGKLKGIEFIFYGLGEIDYVKFYNLFGLVYKDEFNGK